MARQVCRENSFAPGQRRTSLWYVKMTFKWEIDGYMKTEKIVDKSGTLFAFEVRNDILSLGTISKILFSVDGVTDIKRHRYFGLLNFKSDVRVEFKFNETDFVVVEPFGDNSMFWIGPKDVSHRSDRIRKIEEVFAKYRQPFILKLIADLISLNIKELGKR